MKVLLGDQWVSEDEVVIGEKEFVHSPIAKIPPGGYKTDQYSKSSIQYLEGVSRRDNIKIRHALNGGEIRLPGTRYRLDGYSYETYTTFEYQGCVYHGCPRCFPEVIYVSKTGENDVPLGDYLGELTNELETGEHIIEFVSGGPKNYAYKTNNGNETCKVRGFTLNFTNSQLINFESVKTLLIDPSEKSTITVTNPHKICRDKGKRKMYNREDEKNYRMVYTKR